VRFQPISPDALIEELAATIDRAAGGAATAGGRLRVAIDGPPASAPERLAAALVDPLRVRGRAALPVSTGDFLRPASVRLEHGRTNPDTYYESWFDLAAVDREVLGPAGPDGTGRVLPTFWDPTTDRATRADYVCLPAGGVLLLSGPLLLGAGLAVDYAVHLLVTPGARARRTPPEQRWTLPAFDRYAAEVAPETFADAVVRFDDPAHPAALFR
jgi:hypothetical protein